MSKHEALTLSACLERVNELAMLPKECAEVMGMTVDAIRNYCARGRLVGAVRFGSEWIIPRESVTEYMATRRGQQGNKSKKKAAE